METTLRWQISKTIHFIFNCFWCVPDFEYSDKEIMEKLLFFFFKSHLQHPELLFLHSHSLAFLDKLEESNSSFLARSIVPGLVSEGLRALTSFWRSPLRYNWHHFSGWGKLEFSSWCSIRLRLDSNPEMFYHLSLAHHSWAVLLRFHSRIIFLSQISSRKARLYLLLMLFSWLFHTTLILYQDLRQDFLITPVFNTKCINFVLSMNLATRGFFKSTSSQHSLSLPVCLESFH